MKLEEMNATQKKAFNNIKCAANDLLGGLENTMMDYPESSEEYQSAKRDLANRNSLIKQLYYMATTAIYGEGFYCANPLTVEMELREINFCGKEWLLERCEKRIIKEGY